MIDTKIDGGPAFPMKIALERDVRTGAELKVEVYSGMSLRDYFAAKALNGLLAMPEAEGFTAPYSSIDGAVKHYAELSYRYADAMLKARDAT